MILAKFTCPLNRDSYTNVDNIKGTLKTANLNHVCSKKGIVLQCSGYFKLGFRHVQLVQLNQYDGVLSNF